MTQMMHLVFQILRSREYFTDNVLSHETVDPYLIKLKMDLIGHGFHALLINEHSLKIILHSFFETRSNSY